MTLDELETLCQARRAAVARMGLGSVDEAHVVLTVPGRWGAKQHTRAWRRGPWGRVVAEVDRDGVPSVLVDVRLVDLEAAQPWVRP